MRREKRVISTDVFLAVTYTDLGRHGRCRAQRTCHSSSTPPRYNTYTTRLRWDPHGGWRRVPASSQWPDSSVGLSLRICACHREPASQLRLKLLSAPSFGIYSEFLGGMKFQQTMGVGCIFCCRILFTPIFIIIVISFLCILIKQRTKESKCDVWWPAKQLTLFPFCLFSTQ